MFCLLPVPVAVCLCLSGMRWFHAAAGGTSNGVEIKLHQNKEAVRLQALAPDWTASLVGSGKWKDSIRSGLPVTFSSSIKPFTDYPLESREGKQAPACPLGRGKEEVLAFPQVAEGVS